MGTYLSTPKTDIEVEFGRGYDISYGASGMQGWRRTMEDAHICSAKVEGNDNMSLFGVFDGHGGPEVARFCAKYLSRELAESEHFAKEEYDKALKDAFHRIDDLLCDSKYLEEIILLRSVSGSDAPMDAPDAGAVCGGASQLGQEPAGIPDEPNGIRLRNQLTDSLLQLQGDSPQIHAGCTAIVSLKCGNMLYVANAGDSRGVLSRSGKAVALSTDHKPTCEDEKRRIERAGGSVNYVAGVPRINGNLNLSRAIGDLKYKGNKDLPPEEQVITAHPDVRIFELTEADDFFLLACDGIWDVMSNEEAVAFVAMHLKQGMEPHMVASLLLKHCLAADCTQSFGIGCDNMTSIVVLLNQTSVPEEINESTAHQSG